MRTHAAKLFAIRGVRGKQKGNRANIEVCELQYERENPLLVHMRNGWSLQMPSIR